MTQELERVPTGPAEYLGRHRTTGSAVPTQAEVGDTLAGRYELVERLPPSARQRFLARDRTLDRTVELSLVRADSELADRLRGSASVAGLSSITHPALETIYDVGYDTRLGQSYLVTESVVARPLAEIALTTEQARAVVLQVTDVLECLHDAGLGHRGLDAANIRLITPDDDPAALRCLVTLDGIYRFDADPNPTRGVADDLHDLALLRAGLTTGTTVPDDRSGTRPRPAGRFRPIRLHHHTKGVS